MPPAVEDGTVRLEENQRFARRFVDEFGNVGDIVAPDTENIVCPYRLAVKEYMAHKMFLTVYFEVAMITDTAIIRQKKRHTVLRYAVSGCWVLLCGSGLQRRCVPP